jgi:hypothetical protein
MEIPNQVSHDQLNELIGLLEHESVLIKLRLAGEPWVKDFLKVILVSDNTAILGGGDEKERLFVLKKDVVEFEVNKPCLDFKPNVKYSIVVPE